MALSLYFLSDPDKVRDFNGAIADEAKIVRDYTPILSAFDVVTKAIGHCALREQRIRHLIISGHGSSFEARFGNDAIGLGNIEHYAPLLHRLRPLFEPKAVVTLWGCDVGRNMELLQKFSSILGVKVQGATEEISVWTWGPFSYMGSSEMNVCVFPVCGRGARNFDPRHPDGRIPKRISR
jgi:hypothetical protein